MELNYILIAVGIAFLLLVLLGLAIVNYSTDDLVDKFKNASQYSVGTTPNEFARFINNIHFSGNIKIKYKDGYFSDAYNGNGTLYLSKKYADKYELAGLAICAHELGHAMQIKETPNKMIAHSKRLKMFKSISWLISPLMISAVVCVVLSEYLFAVGLFGIGLIVFFIAITTKLSTLSIEKNASMRAIELLELYVGLDEQQLIIAKQFLSAAKQTYLADLLRIMLKWTFLVKKNK